MGRGEHPWKNHHKKLKGKSQKEKSWNCEQFLLFTFYFLLQKIAYWEL
jgi:hypothetical protein